MKKVLFFAMGLVSMTALAQTGNVGINTEKPRATLDIVGRPITESDKTISRGVILPHISDAQKAEFTDKTEGLMIWNTTKKCIDYWNGTTWQCYGETSNTTPPATTYTGTTIWGDSAGETISATRNNCPSGQRGSTITYPANTSQHITYTATSTVSQADANQKAIDLMNSTAKQQERQTLAQDYANANGTCSTTSFSATKTYTGSTTFTRNNCGSGYNAGSVVYNATASGDATSTISQADADRLALANAQARYNADGQAYANTNASCNPKPLLERMAGCSEFTWDMWPDTINLFRKGETHSSKQLPFQQNISTKADISAYIERMVDKSYISNMDHITVTSNSAVDWSCNLE